MEIHNEKILILDFGSQFTQLIARRIRESKVYCEIHPYNLSLAKIKKFNPKGIILSGGPSSVYDKKAPKIKKDIYEMGVPILGICYGMQLTTEIFKGKVERSLKREYGEAYLNIKSRADLFKNIKDKKIKVWMSHSDKAVKPPKGFKITADTDNAPLCAFANIEKKIYGVQFHPEVHHTPLGKKILKNFVFEICKCKPAWTMKNIVTQSIEDIQAQVGETGKIVCGISGGVDSSVAALLMHKAVGKRLTCIFVDNGLLRKNESDKVYEMLTKNFHMKIKRVKAAPRFLSKLKKVIDPERKRKIIGNEFIHIFNAEAAKIKNVGFLGQGTLYPDVIESVSHKGPSAVIKSHHNVGGLLKNMKLKLVEPLRELFKDEVRLLGREMGMDAELLDRHPFPGPGLGIRILGEVTKKRCDILREADAIVLEEIKKAGLYKKIWQAFAVLLPVKSVGVMGDERTYENTAVVRMVESVDGMTADWVRVPYDVLQKISLRIINEVKGINRVTYDISSKPPSTIEWE